MMILAHIQEMLIALLCQSSYSHILLIFLQENYRFGKISEVIQSKYLLINLLMLLLFLDSHHWPNQISFFLYVTAIFLYW